MEGRFHIGEMPLRREVLAELHVHVAVRPGFHGEQYGEHDQALRRAADARTARLEAGLRDSVTAHLGPEFDAEITDLRSGSVEVVAIILLVSSVAAGYNTVREALLNVVGDWRLFVGHVIDPIVDIPVEVDAYARAGPAMQRLPLTVDAGNPQAVAAQPAVRNRIPLPRWLTTTAAGLLMLAGFAWLTIPLLVIADVV